MTNETKDHKLDGSDRKVNTKLKVGQDNQNRLPHERDESPDSNVADNSDAKRSLRGVMKQAASDIERGLVDTDLHGERGVEKVADAQPMSAKPIRESVKQSTPKTRS